MFLVFEYTCRRFLDPIIISHLTCWGAAKCSPYWLYNFRLRFTMSLFQDRKWESTARVKGVCAHPTQCAYKMLSTIWALVVSYSLKKGLLEPSREKQAKRKRISRSCLSVYWNLWGRFETLCVYLTSKMCLEHPHSEVLFSLLVLEVKNNIFHSSVLRRLQKSNWGALRYPLRQDEMVDSTKSWSLVLYWLGFSRFGEEETSLSSIAKAPK